LNEPNDTKKDSFILIISKSSFKSELLL